MSQKKMTPEEREQRNKEIEEKTAALEKELLALFDAGLPLCYSDSCDPLNDFSVFRGLSAEWDKAIDTLLKEASYLDDIFLPSLISEHLRDLPEETSVAVITIAYGIKKLDTGKNATFTYNVMGGNRLSDEEWEQIKYNPHIEMEE